MSTCEKRPGRYRLTTAEITYHLPDHPHILQSFVWQNLDLVPTFPALHRFLAFWQRNLEGKVHSVKVACSGNDTKNTAHVGRMVVTLRE